MDKNIFNYELPQELIAQQPLPERSHSRLLVLDKGLGRINHEAFKNIHKYINAGDCLVINDTRVIPAKLLGRKKDTGGKIEFVLLKSVGKDIWEIILKPGRRARPGSRFIFGEGELEAEIVEVVEQGNRLARFYYDGIFEEILDRVGVIPLPPYITGKLDDSERYQTVYSRERGSAAAPTAGLHFTESILKGLLEKGVLIAKVTLHVGLGTFRPVKSEKIEEHEMHSEYYNIDEEAARMINDTKINGGKIIAVGTTSSRVLETVGKSNGTVSPGNGLTDIFIYPGYNFKVVDSLITNFHLPGSTLIMLVSALAGRDNIMDAYQEAVKEKYRFYSFGDAMLIK